MEALGSGADWGAIENEFACNVALVICRIYLGLMRRGKRIGTLIEEARAGKRKERIAGTIVILTRRVEERPMTLLFHVYSIRLPVRSPQFATRNAS